MPEIAAKNLKPGTVVISATGKRFSVSSVKNTETRTIVIFDGDMEIDFKHHDQVRVATEVINQNMA